MKPNLQTIWLKMKKKKECYRVDKLILEHIEKKLQDSNLKKEMVDELNNLKLELDSFNEKKFDETIEKYSIKSPDNNTLSKSYPFNLMFGTEIGPSGKTKGYLRPETAQGLFVNFKRLYNYNGCQMPFAGATIGKAFRNEIAPRSGLLRVREFTLAEIEHFVNPKKKDHHRYKNIKNLKIKFFPRERQNEKKGIIEITIDDALNQGMLNNQTHAYFLGRVYLFMLECGLLKEGIRFRQHLSNEMAHYATDCWDCELLTSYGWIECVGIADRSCYDLTKHEEHSKHDLTAYEEYEAPKLECIFEFEQIKGGIGKKFKEHSKQIIEYLTNLKDEDKITFQKELDSNKFKIINLNNKEFEITDEMCRFVKREKKFLDTIILLLL